MFQTGPILLLPIVVAGAAAICLYRWGYTAGVAATADRTHHAAKVAHQAAAESHETLGLVYTVERQLLAAIQRADGKAESAHAKADRIETQLGDRISHIEGECVGQVVKEMSTSIRQAMTGTEEV